MRMSAPDTVCEGASAMALSAPTGKKAPNRSLSNKPFMIKGRMRIYHGKRGKVGVGAVIIIEGFFATALATPYGDFAKCINGECKRRATPQAAHRSGFEHGPRNNVRARPVSAVRGEVTLRVRFPPGDVADVAATYKSRVSVRARTARLTHRVFRRVKPLAVKTSSGSVAV